VEAHLCDAQYLEALAKREGNRRSDGDMKEGENLPLLHPFAGSNPEAAYRCPGWATFKR